MLVLLLLLMELGKCAGGSKKTSSPNIIFIFADDMGFNDAGYQGSDILTPNLDNLAENGLILDQHYGQPMCAPSRASFMSGKYPIHTGFHEANIQQGELWGLDLDEYTVGQMFQHYGYSTHAIGKWHLGWRTWLHTPVMRGFDTFLGFYFCAHDHFSYDCGSLGAHNASQKSERSLRKIQKEINRRNGLPPWSGLIKNKKLKFFDLRYNYLNSRGQLVDKIRYDLAGQYSSRVFTNHAMDTIKNRDPNKPFFMYLSYMNVHAPYQAPEEDLERFTTHMAGYASRKRRNYAAMMSSLDEGVGNITALLKEEGLYEKTLIVFSSDNGANVGYCKTGKSSNAGENPAAVEGTREPGSNFPLRGGKRSVFEGGIRLASLVHGPGLIRNPGRISSDMVHLVDWYTTFQDIVQEYDTTNTDPPVTSPKDGISFWRVLKKGLPGKRRSFLININKRGGISCGPTRAFKAIRSGNWKLIVGGGGPPSDWFHPYKDPIPSTPLTYYQLYHIKNDPYETTNVAEMYPAMVLQLLHDIAELEHTMVPSRKRKKENLTSRLRNGTVPTPLQPSESDEIMYTGSVRGQIHDVEVIQIVQKP